ncbi:MAG: hypothetical protein ACTSWN_01175 [Promethearchaeota archaeon]
MISFFLGFSISVNERVNSRRSINLRNGLETHHCWTCMVIDSCDSCGLFNRESSTFHCHR